MQLKQGINLLLEQIPYVSMLQELPVVGSYVSGFKNFVSEGLAELFGVQPKPPELPAGYKYGSAVKFGSVPTNMTESELQEAKNQGMKVENVDLFFINFNTIGPVVGESKKENTVIDESTGVPVAFYLSGSERFIQVIGFTLEGFAIFEEDFREYKGKRVIKKSESRL